MQSASRARPRSPYGISFAIEDLVRVRDWAARRRLVLSVALDRVIDEAEFEEMLLLLTADRRRRVLTLWRTGAGVVAQATGGSPRAFASVAAALTAMPVRAPRRSWLGF